MGAWALPVESHRAHGALLQVCTSHIYQLLYQPPCKQAIQHRFQRQRLQWFRQQRQSRFQHCTSHGFALVRAEDQRGARVMALQQAFAQDDASVAIVQVEIEHPQICRPLRDCIVCIAFVRNTADATSPTCQHPRQRIECLRIVVHDQYVRPVQADFRNAARCPRRCFDNMWNRQRKDAADADTAVQMERRIEQSRNAVSNCKAQAEALSRCIFSAPEFLEKLLLIGLGNARPRVMHLYADSISRAAHAQQDVAAHRVTHCVGKEVLQHASQQLRIAPDPRMGGYVSKSKAVLGGALLASMNTASEYGFGAVIAALPGFLVVANALQAIPDPLVNEAVSVTALAGITGSASGGMSIALAAMADTFIANANAAGIPMEVLHRVASMASGGMDTLPHNGAVITLLAVTGLTHRQAYKDIFAITVIKTMAVFVVIAVFYATGLV